MNEVKKKLFLAEEKKEGDFGDCVLSSIMTK